MIIRSWINFNVARKVVIKACAVGFVNGVNAKHKHQVSTAVPNRF